MKGMNDREIRGYSILAKGDSPEIVDANTYFVPSQSCKDKYRVFGDGDKWSCSCPDYQNRGLPCKHIFAVRFWLSLRQKVMKKQNIVQEIQEQFCPYCHSTELIKRGIRKNQYTQKQRFSCKACGKRFVIDQFKKFKGDAKTITLVLDLYFKGVSLRKIKDHLRQFYGMDIGHVTIYRWVTKFMKAMNDYVAQFRPDLSDLWHADEQVVKARNKEHEYGIAYMWNVLDSRTRFLIANKVTPIRSRDEAEQVFRDAERNAGKIPDVVVTDKFAGYGHGIREGFSKHVKHEKYKGFTARIQNNKVERYHNTFRERDKTMRGFQSTENARVMAEAFRTHYNYLRPHQALNGLTPAQVAGIDLNLGQNRTLGLLTKAVRQ